MCEMRRNGRADDQALDLPEERLFGHECLQPPTGLADGLEVGSPLPDPRAGLKTGSHVSGFAPVSDCSRGSPVSPLWGANLALDPLCDRRRGAARRQRRTYELFTTFSRRRAASTSQVAEWR